MNEIKEKEKDELIATVAMRYGYREGQRRKKSALFRAQKKNGLDKIRQLVKRSKSLIDEVNSLSEFIEERNKIIVEMQNLREQMNSATVLERSEVRLFNIVVKYYDGLVQKWLMEHEMFKPQTDVPVELEETVKELEKEKETPKQEKKTPKQKQKQ